MSIRDDLDDLIDGRVTWPAFVAGRNLDADEAALVRSYLRRGGIRGLEHVADARATRRVTDPG
ncbi:hypothetical protein [Antarcticirhabdus aurantiaca]|uniref:hypothetical protein n=1 Tax=Antarcticirhabdus aurantiaca TaxID=2606717 RepID=UPI00131A91BD|nr:hypothetical protein [Antarcticirhabdus aurantiaca]